MTKAEIISMLESGLDLIPTHMREGVRAHVEYGRETGGFLTALLEGDEAAFRRADPVNLANADQWMRFLHHHLPADCHGSPGKVAAWRKMGGLDGYPDGQQ